MRAGLLSTIGNAGIEKQVVDVVVADFVERLLGEALDALEVRQLARQYCQRIGRSVILELVEGRLGALNVPGA